MSWKDRKRSRSRGLDTKDEVQSLEPMLVEAVKFVPPDEGEDSATTVEVELSDLRSLVEAAWRAEEVARKAHREAREFRSLFREVDRLRRNS